MITPERHLAAFTEHVCVVIPMYRVEDHIEAVIRSMPAWVWRIVVVDDASPDRSAVRVAEIDDPRVVMVTHEQNQGVGGAMLSGYERAAQIGATVMVKVDGDGQMPLEYLPMLVEPVIDGRADYSKGNRFVQTRELTAMPFLRRVGNLGLSFLAKLATGYWNVFDPTNGFTVLDVDTYRRLNPQNISRRYYFETSLLAELNLARAAIEEVPMPARYLGEQSSLSVSRAALEFPVLLLRSFLRRIELQYFVLDFSASSLFLTLGVLAMALSSLWGAFAWVRSSRTGIPATTGTVMIAVLPFILGFQMALQAVVLDIQNVPRQVQSRLAPHRLRKSQRSPALGDLPWGHHPASEGTGERNAETTNQVNN